MSKRRHVPDHIRRSAVRDYYEGDETAAAVAARYGIPRSTFAAWVSPARDDIALTGGTWVLVGGVQRWQPFVRQSTRDQTDQQRRVEWEDAMFDVDESRDLHARYANGCREPRTVVGERVYQRRKKRAQTARKKAA